MKPFLTALFAIAFLAASVSAAENTPAAKVQTHCPVSGEKLESMGKPVKVRHAGRTIKLCCKPCVKKFKADPEKYFKKLK